MLKGIVCSQGVCRHTAPHKTPRSTAGCAEQLAKVHPKDERQPSSGQQTKCLSKERLHTDWVYFAQDCSQAKRLWGKCVADQKCVSCVLLVLVTMTIDSHSPGCKKAAFVKRSRMICMLDLCTSRKKAPQLIAHTVLQDVTLGGHVARGPSALHEAATSKVKKQETSAQQYGRHISFPSVGTMTQTKGTMQA